ncbi:unnamed protein product [Phaeothamnion confervicola]
MKLAGPMCALCAASGTCAFQRGPAPSLLGAVSSARARNTAPPAWARGRRATMVSDAPAKADALGKSSEGVTAGKEGEVSFKLDTEVDEVYPVRGYDGAFKRSVRRASARFAVDAPPADATDAPTPARPMLRVLVVGGGTAERRVVENVAARDAMVCGLYVTWDDTVVPLDEAVAEVPFTNLYRCEQPGDPAEVARLAAFIAADIVIVGSSYEGKANFVSGLRDALPSEALFLDPAAAAAIAGGDLDSFVAVAEAKRDAMAVELAALREIEAAEEAEAAAAAAAEAATEVGATATA